MSNRALARAAHVTVVCLALLGAWGVLLAAEAVTATEVAALTSATSLPAGSAPVGIAIDPATGRIYVTNSGSDTVSVIDPATNAVIAGNLPQSTFTESSVLLTRASS